MRTFAIFVPDLNFPVAMLPGFERFALIIDCAGVVTIDFAAVPEVAGFHEFVGGDENVIGGLFLVFVCRFKFPAQARCGLVDAERIVEILALEGDRLEARVSRESNECEDKGNAAKFLHKAVVQRERI